MSLTDEDRALKPCPFCGGDAHVIEDRDGPLLYRPQCKLCGASRGGLHVRGNAIKAWNERARDLERCDEPEPLREALYSTLWLTIGLVLTQYEPAKLAPPFEERLASQREAVVWAANEILQMFALLAAAREQPRQPPEDVREKVARIVEDAMVANEDCAARDASTPRYFAGKAADAILALPAVAVGDGWRPIETAPKDGTLALLWLGDKAEIAQWQWRLDCWVTPDELLEIGKRVPTHWQPLPAPPHGGGG